MYNENDFLRIMEQINEFGKNSYELQLTGLCMMFDQCAAKYGIPVMDIVETVKDAVKSVNEQEGPYNPDIAFAMDAMFN